MANRSKLACLAWTAILASNVALADLPPECGTIVVANDSQFGPFDYRDPKLVNERRVVNDYHFTRNVEFLIKAKTGNIAGDLAYTLNAFPNHHRALYSIIRYHTDPNAVKRPPTRYSADCYFQRAIEWRADDAMVRLLYGMYLIKVDRFDDARVQIQRAAELDLSSPEFHYNLGLSFLDLGDVEKARDHAKIAYSGGYPLPGLRTRLEALDAW